MARNKYPEETVSLILDVSLKLFMQQGYEHTSIQDITDHLGGLTKGAIYHHFATKEDILSAVIDRVYQGYGADWDKILRDTSMTGLQKLREVFRFSINSGAPAVVYQTAPDLRKSPHMLVLMLRSVMEESAPRYVQPIIEQGVADGSIQTEYPAELAEIILLLINVWINPMVSCSDSETIRRRMGLFRQTLLGLGVDIIDDEIVGNMIEFSHLYNANR